MNPNQVHSTPGLPANAGIAPSIVGTTWSAGDIHLLRVIRNDNTNESQRAFAALVLDDFPGRTYQGVYHQVRYIDMLTRLEDATTIAVEIG